MRARKNRRGEPAPGHVYGGWSPARRNPGEPDAFAVAVTPAKGGFRYQAMDIDAMEIVARSTRAYPTQRSAVSAARRALRRVVEERLGRASSRSQRGSGRLRSLLTKV